MHATGALFFVGDGHAGQGNGEVDITGLETSLTGTLQLIVRKDLHLTLAAKDAVREMIAFLVTEKHLSRDDAYMLCSVAGDLDVTQVVDGTRGAHMILPKSIFGKVKGKKNKN